MTFEQIAELRQIHSHTAGVIDRFDSLHRPKVRPWESPRRMLNWI